MQRARWMEQAFYLLWRQGVDAITWYLLVDQPPVPNYASTYQSGVYYLNGRPKPGLQAFSLPFVVQRTSSQRATVWGMSPVSGTVLVQRLLRPGAWATVLRVRVQAHGIFTRTIALAPGTVTRAWADGETSLQWRS